MKVSLLQAAVASAALGLAATSHADFDPMLKGLDGYTVLDPLLTIGETINGYTPPGILDGLGAYKINGNTVRVKEVPKYPHNEHSDEKAFLVSRHNCLILDTEI